MASAGQHKATVILDGKADGLNKAARQSSNSVGKLEEKVERLEAALNKANAKIDRFAQENNRAAASSRKASTQINASRQNWSNLVTGVQGAISVFQTATDVIDRVAERSFRLDNVQANLPFSIEAAREATQGLVSDYDLMQQAITANRLGVAKSEKDFARAAEIATKLSVSVGQDATKGLEDFVNGLGRGSTEVLDNLGIVLRAQEAYELYAASLGKTTSQLTEAQKRQAVINLGIEKGADAARDAKVEIDGWAGAWERAKVSVSNTADKVVDLDDNIADLTREGLLAMNIEGQKANEIVSRLGENVQDATLDFLTMGLAGQGNARAVERARVEVEEMSATIQRGQPQWSVMLHFLQQSGSLAERAEKTVHDLAAGFEQLGRRNEQDQALFAWQAEEAMRQLHFETTGRKAREEIWKEREKRRKKGIKNALRDARALVEAEGQIQIQGARQELELLQQRAENREATSAEVIEQITVVETAEREAAEARLQFAKTEADQLRILSELRSIEHTADMERAEERKRADEDAIALIEAAAEATKQQANEARTLRLAQAEIAANQAQRQADLVEDPIERMERETQARLELIDVQLAAANDPIDAMMLADEREQAIHERRLVRIEQARKAEAEALAQRQAMINMGVSVLEGYAHASIEAALASGEGLRMAVAMESKAMGLRHAKIAVSESLRALVALAGGNFGAAALHGQAAAANAAFAVSLGAAAGALGAFGGRNKQVEGIGADAFGGGVGPGARGGPSGPTSSADPNPIPNSPTTAGSTSQGRSPAQVVVNINGPIAGNFKDMARRLDKELRNLNHVNGRAAI